MQYEICENYLKVNPWIELYEVDSENLAKIIVRIVEKEGPVHFDEVVRRIRYFWGLNRTRARIREAISKATVNAQNNKLIRVKGEFLWPMQEIPVRVRYRDNDPPPRGLAIAGSLKRPKRKQKRPVDT